VLGINVAECQSVVGVEIDQIIILTGSVEVRGRWLHRYSLEKEVWPEPWSLSEKSTKASGGPG
jgi:hypothetical protein